MKYPKAFTSLVAATLSLTLGLSACGGSSSDTKSAPVPETEEVVEDKTAEVAQEEVEEATPEATDDKGAVPESTAAAEEFAEDAQEWVDAWMGKGSSGEYYYYAESPDGSEGIMVIYDEELNQYVTFAGTNTTDEKTGYITLTDEESGLALTYEVTDVQGDTVTLDLGEYGTVDLASCTIDEVIDAFTVIYIGGTDALTVAEDSATLEQNLRMLTKGWTDSWMGESSSGESYYYAEAGDTEDALMLIVDPKSKEYLSFVGTSTFDEKTNLITTTDDSSGLTISYEVVDATDDTITIDVGEYGKATLKTCTMDEFIDAFVATAASCTPVN